jgi:hypothetical protein
MADITLSWSSLTCRALAERHAVRWSRRISAISSAARGIAAGGYAGGGTCLRLFSAFSDLLRFACDSRSSGLSTLAIMPVVTRK